MVTQSGKILGNLIDVDRGIISREIFTSDELYKQQLERIFGRSWLFVGFESQVPNPNDYFISRMGEESVILTRDRQGKIHVLLNTCMHRGMKVCRYDEGNTPVFSCPYHGWSYSTDGNLVSVPGELIGVPQFATAYHGELKKEDWGLISVPQMATYNGTVWACWDKNAPPFLDYMGNMIKFFDAVIAGAESHLGGGALRLQEDRRAGHQHDPVLRMGVRDHHEQRQRSRQRQKGIVTATPHKSVEDQR